MVIDDKLPWRVILRVHSFWLLATALMALAVYAVTHVLHVKLPFTPVPFQIAGVALAIFLAFRNNSSYDRWWEGRKLWGGIVNASRTWARQATTLLPSDTPEASALVKRLVYRQLAWVSALKCQLRGEAVSGLEGFLSDEERAALPAQKNAAVFLLQRAGEDLRQAAARGWLTDLRLELLDRTLTELTALQGGCERIKSTPIPAAYRVFTHRFTRAYTTLLPLGFVSDLELATVPMLVLLALALMVLETIGRLLEEPFTVSPNGLPLNTIARNIELNLRQQLGETSLPPPVEPQYVDDFKVLL